MEICYLKECPEHIEEMSCLFYREWGHLIPGKSVSDVAAMLRERALNTVNLPLAMVAREGSEWVGSASLKHQDMDTHFDLTPWLAAVYVKQACRGRGIARLLIAEVAQKAAELGYKEIFLYTPSAEGYYRRLGWGACGYETYKGSQVTIMRHAL